MIHQPTIVILLSTWNGAKYLPEQLQSLLDQNYEDVLIVVRDDGSSDNTLGVIRDYMLRQPDRIRLIDEGGPNLGACGSFARLVKYCLEHKQELGVDTLYMMFCDQDDTWYPDKITRQINAMLATEDELAETHEQPVPVLVHSDLQVVTENNEPIAESLARFQGLETQRNSFHNMVISNLVTGCTALFNEALARKALPIPDRAIMHDWWFAIVAAAYGKVVYLDTPLVHYRQHGANTIGAKEKIAQGPTTVSFWRKLVGPAPNEHLYEVARQAKVFLACFGPELPGRSRRALRLCTGMAARVGFVQRFFYRLARRL